MAGVGGVGGKFIDGMKGLGETIKSKFDSFKPELPSKDTIKDTIKNKFSKDTMTAIGSGLKNGTIKVLKKTAGGTLVALSLITPKKQSETLSQTGMKLLSREEIAGYGAYKREKIALQGMIVMAKATQVLGKGLASIGNKIMKHSDSSSKIWSGAWNVKWKGEQTITKGKVDQDINKNKLGRHKEKRKAEKANVQNSDQPEQKAKPISVHFEEDTKEK
jgi:hypothetical protein